MLKTNTIIILMKSLQKAVDKAITENSKKPIKTNTQLVKSSGDGLCHWRNF